MYGSVREVAPDVLILPMYIYVHTPGEAVFERQNVHEGATATQWRRNGRVVRAGEKPARVVAVKGKGKRGPQQQQQQSPAAAAAAGKGAGGERGEESSSLAGGSGAEEASVASGSTQGTGKQQQQRSVKLYGFWQVGGLRVSVDGR